MLDNIINTGLEVLAVVQPEVVEGETQEVIWQLPAELGGAVQVVVLEEVLELEELPLGTVEEAVSDGGWKRYGAGGGGSGYVFTTSAYKLSGYKLGSEYYLSDAQTIAGDQSFPAPGGGNETGHSGSGYARITLIE